MRSWTVDDLRLLLDPAVTVNTIMARLHIPKRATVTFELVRMHRAGLPVPARSSNPE